MTSEQIRLFVQIAESGSLTKVAIEANLQQSLISRKLSALEAKCGGRLFHRTGRGVTLTEFGASFLARAKQTLSQLDRLGEDMRSAAEAPSGDVRFGLLPALSDPLVSILYRKTREQFPRVRLHLFEGSNGQLQEWVDSARLDLALLYRYDRVDPSMHRVLGTIPAYLVGARGSNATSRDSIAFSALDGLPLILPSAPNALRHTLDQIAKRLALTLNVAVEADSLPIQKAIAAEGSAYAVLGRQAVAREVQAGRLQASCIVDPMIERTAILAFAARRSSAAHAIAQLIEPLVLKMLKGEAGG
jgi:DNA-binding transcriptional LysR family regulator